MTHKKEFQKFLCILLLPVLFWSAFAAIQYGRTGSTMTSADIIEGTRVPVVMYHLIVDKNKIYDNYTITPAQLERDFDYLKQNGYETVVVADLINYVYYGGSLPPKPVMITFDDGYYNNYFYAFPLLKKYNMKAVISIVGMYSETMGWDENPNIYSYLTWQQMREMLDSGYIEIQNHSYSLHEYTNKRHGAKKCKRESFEEYEKILTEDLLKTQELLSRNLNGYQPTAFAYPFGAVCCEAQDIIKKIGFLASFSCAEGISIITPGDPDSLHCIKRYNRPKGKSSYDFFKKIK